MTISQKNDSLLPMSWFVLAVLTTVASASRDFLSKQLTREFHPFVVARGLLTRSWFLQIKTPNLSDPSTTVSMIATTPLHLIFLTSVLRHIRSEESAPSGTTAWRIGNARWSLVYSLFDKYQRANRKLKNGQFRRPLLYSLPKAMSNELRNYLCQISKAELHVHLEGTVSAGTLLELARRNELHLSEAVTLSDGRTVLPPEGTVEGKPTLRNFEDFIGLYLKITESIRNKDDITLLTSRFGESAKQQGIEYAEVYFSPTTFLSFGRDLEVLFSGLAAAQDNLESSFGLRVNWIFDIVRNAQYAPELTIELAEQARTNGVRVAAIGLAGYEAVAPAKPFANAFRLAKTKGFQTLAHAGETAGAESVRETLEHLKPERIGHGVRALEDPKLVEILRRSQTPLEVCPWSNLLLGISTAEQHPIAQMIDSGLNVIIGSDDPGIFGKDLIDNYLFAAEQGISKEQLAEIAEKSLQYRL